MTKSQCPKARFEDLVVQSLDGETLIYDLKTNEAHCLNETAAFIWNSCKGDRSIDDLTTDVEGKFGHRVQPEMVRFALKQLDDKKLMVDSGIVGLAMPSRRQVIKKIGLASAVAIPIVASLVTPSSVYAAASCACTAPGDCLTQTGCPSTINCNVVSFICAP
jgi:hypothetical protein